MSDSQDRETRRISPAASGPELDTADEIDLAQLWGILWTGKWKIAAFIVAAVLLAVFYLYVVQPTYKADALLQIQSSESSVLSGLSEDLQALTGTGTSTAQSVIPIIKSRTVLKKTVNALNLAVTAAPQYFPVIGRAVAAHSEADQPAKSAVPPGSGWWLTYYAWAPTKISVTRMQVSEPLLGAAFTLRALGGNQFVLYGPKGEKILEGQVGEAAVGKTKTGGRIKLFVSRLTTSAPPTDFTLVHRPWLPVVESLQARLNISEVGEETGVLRISLKGTNRQQIAKIVNSVANRYLRHNVKVRSKQAQKTLAFLEKKLPDLRKQLRAAEAALAQFRKKQNMINLDAESQALLNRIVSITNKRSKLRLKLAELKQVYTSEHPAVESVREQMQALEQKLANLREKVGDLPSAQKKLLRLRRNVEVSTKLYTALLNRAQQLRVIKAGTVSNVRIVDHAVVPRSAVGPNAKLVLALALVLGGMLGCGFVFLQAALRRGINDPKEIENKLGLPVYAVIPYSNWQVRHKRRADKRGEFPPVLAGEHGDDPTVEALRSLRTSLYFAQMDSGSNTIVVTGPAPDVGKSFVSVNLAYLLSEVGQSVVIVDADMRKGFMHKHVEGQDRDPGLSKVLSGQATLEETLRNVRGTNIKALTSGQLPPNPSELLMREDFAALIERLKAQFDIVLIDAPPILAVTDASIIAASAPGAVTFMVARAGMHPMPELEESVSRMDRHDSQIAGVVFNAYKQEHASYAGGYGYYYQYEYKKAT